VIQRNAADDLWTSCEVIHEATSGGGVVVQDGTAVVHGIEDSSIERNSGSLDIFHIFVFTFMICCIGH
jgi:hypothetical protein